MKGRVQYIAKEDVYCQICKQKKAPIIKQIVFKNTKSFTCAAYCSRCGQYITNIPKSDIKIKRKDK